MKRYTERIRENEYATSNAIIKELNIDENNNDDNYIKMQQRNIINTLINKLGKLEDLEEELGCPLNVLGKASNQKQIYVKKFNMYVEIRNIVIYEQATRPYIEYFYRDKDKVKVREVWIDEYKQTWWLKEDNSE